MEEKVNQLQGKTHVFLTGDRGAGKSWIARRAAELTGRPCYGFVTRFDGERKALYMTAPAEAERPDEAHRVAERRNGRMRQIGGRFDEVGTALLAEARKHPEGLILMDECGHLEKDAARFRQEILRCLDGGIPVLGVLRKGQEWHREILDHPRTAVVEIGPCDPEKLAEEIARTLEGKA